MSTTSLVTLATESHSNELPIHPYAIGAIAFGILLALLIAMLSFGKGREHS